MAQVQGAIFTSHAAWVNTPADQWDGVRATRHHRDDVPTESDLVKAEKVQRMKDGQRILGDKLREMNPDVLVIFGDDQYECFNFENLPSLSIYTGPAFSGRQPGDAPNSGNRPEGGDTGPVPTVPGHPALATSILTGLLDRGFDPAFSMSLPSGARGMAHAIMNPLRFWKLYSVPTVPVLINAYYAPQMRAKRCYEVGRAIRQIIDAFPEEMRVVVVGSGGLWHTPNRDAAYLDEEFDKRGLQYLSVGDIAGWADFFDGYKVPEGDRSQYIESGPGMSGLPTLGGPQLGTRETCNWIGAAAVIDSRPSVVVDYVPVYASPLGVAFAYCDKV